MTSEVMDLRRTRSEPWAMTTSSTAHSPTPSGTTDRDHGAGLVHPLAAPFLLVDAATTGLNGLAYVLAGSATPA